MGTDLEEDILRSLRRITRCIDLHSRQLVNTYGLTGPQLVCLRTIGKTGEMTPSRLAKEVALSQPTVTGIIDRLAARQLVRRERSTSDRRVVTVQITDAGRALIDAAPSPLQERFARRLGALTPAERENIRTTLATIVTMMDGDEIDAAPVLTPGPVSAEVVEPLSPDEVSTSGVAEGERR